MDNIGDQSVTLVEDIARSIGSELAGIIGSTMPTSIGSIIVNGFPPGTTVSYVDPDGNTMTATAGDDGLELVFSAPSVANLLQSLETLTVLDAPQDDEDYVLNVEIVNADDPTASQSFPVTVEVLAVADPPMIEAEDVSLMQSSSAPLIINPSRSSDDDGSEVLSVTLMVASDGSGAPIGTLSVPQSVDGVTFTDLGDGNYLVEATGDTVEERESNLDQLLATGGVVFTPRDDVTGNFPEGIEVVATSTETGTAICAPCITFLSTLHVVCHRCERSWQQCNPGNCR